MTELTRNIHNSIFGETPTNELLSMAFEKKKNYFGNTITYSPKVFIPLTTMCRDSCAYCTFVKSPKEGGTYLNEEEVKTIASAGNEAGCYEALFTLGDKPELKWDHASNELSKLGFSSTHEYLIHIANAVRKHIEQNQKLETADFRNLSQLGRKVAVQILEYLDKIGFTKRKFNYRELRDEDLLKG